MKRLSGTVSYDMWLPDILKVSFWGFLSNTKNGVNFNLPTPYGRTTIQLQEGVEGAKQPHDKGSAHGSRWVFAPIPPVIGFMAGCMMTLTKMWVPICLYCSNCTKFGQLILRKIVKIVATRCEILWLKCTKFDFGWGSAPDPAGRAYSAPQTHSCIWGPYF